MVVSLDRAGAADGGRAALTSAVSPVQPSETLVAPTLPLPPDREQLFLAPAALLPADLRALCSCAGLFYARVWDVLETDEGPVYDLEVAALARYFTGPGTTYQQHVRGFDLPANQFTFFLEWDRALDAMATSDVRDLVEEHARRATIAIPAEPVALEREEEADLLPLPQMFVTRTAVRDALDKTQANEHGRRIVQTALLEAALETLSEQLEQRWMGQQERCQLERCYEQIRAVQQWRRTRRTWQRVVAFAPVLDQGRRGWDIVIGVPVDLVA